MPTTRNGEIQFSVIIPTHARPERLRACLEGMSALDFPRDQFEVIVSDDGSPTPVEPVVAPFRDRLRITLVNHPKTGPAAARNRGAAQARGRYLAFTDDDCVPDPGWLRALARHLVAEPDYMVGGQTQNLLLDNPFSTASQQLVSYLYEYYNADAVHARFFTSNNLAVPAERFRDVGGLDTTFPRAAGEDRELCERWRARGYGMLHAPDAVVYHAHVLTLRRFWRQHFHYGRAAWHCYRLRAQRGRGRLRSEPLAFYLNLLRYPFADGTSARAWLHAALLGLSQVANAAGASWEAVTESWMQVNSRHPVAGRNVK